MFRLALIPALIVSLSLAGTATANEPEATETPTSAAERVEAVLSWARAYVGIPYRIGSEGPNLFDCSGLVFRAFADAGQLPRIGGARLRAAGYQRWFTQRGMLRATEAEAQRGDLVMYERGEHIGFYLGEGRVISALTSGVAVHSLRGIDKAVTGFLAVDYSGKGGDAPIVADPGTIEFEPETPETPASLVPAVPWMPELTEADSPKSESERPDMRTANSRSFDNGDGTFTTEFHAQPIHYQAADSDAWLPIDLSFSLAGEDAAGEAVVIDSPANMALWPASSRAPFLEVAAGEYAVRLTALDAARDEAHAASPQISADARHVDYFDFLASGAGLRVFARADGFKAFVVLPEEPRDNLFSFAIDAPGLTPVAERDGTISLRTSDDTIVGRLPRPLLLDSSDIEGDGGGAFTAAAGLRLGHDDEGTPVVTVAVDRRYLDETVYPAYVDLSVIDFPQTSPGDLTFVSSRHPNANFDAYQRPEEPAIAELWHGRQPGTSHANEVYLRFADLAATLGGVTVDSAALSLLPYWQSGGADVATAAGEIASDWSAGQLTWNERPAAAEDVAELESAAGEWSSIDVSAYMAGVLGGDPDYGLVLGATQTSSDWMRFVAQQGTDPASLGPRLSVEWSSLRPTTMQSGDAFATAPSLQWSNPFLAAEQARFRIQISSDGFETLAVGSGPVKGEAGRVNEWAVPTESLADGPEYAWRVSVKYGEDRAWTAWSEPGTFTLGVPNAGSERF